MEKSPSDGDIVETSGQVRLFPDESSDFDEEIYQNHLKEFTYIRSGYKSGWVDVEQILQLVAEFAHLLAGLSGCYGRDDRDDPHGRTGRDVFVTFMHEEIRYMWETHFIYIQDDKSKLYDNPICYYPNFPLRHTPLCCSFLMRLAQECENAWRPRLALEAYQRAQHISSEDSEMQEITVRAASEIKRLVAAEGDSSSPTRDSKQKPAFIFGPFYRLDENNVWISEFEFYLLDGRTSVKEIIFCLCDFMEKKSGGDREKYVEELCALPAVAKDFPTGTPLHCSILLHCAQEWKKMGQLDEAVMSYCCIRKMAFRDPEMSLIKKESTDELVKIFNGELHINSDVCEVILADVSHYRQRFLELVDYRSLRDVGHHFMEVRNYEEAIECFSHCLVKNATCHSGYASVDLWYLSKLYKELGELQAALILLEQSIHGPELENCQCREPQIGSAIAAAQFDPKLGRRVRCPRHHLLPLILIDQGILQSHYGSKEEAKETFEMGMQLARECGDSVLVTLCQEALTQIIVWQHNDSGLHMSGNFSLSREDHKISMKEDFEKYIAIQQELPKSTANHPEQSWDFEDFNEWLKNLSDQFCKPGNPSIDDMERTLDQDRKDLEEMMRIPKEEIMGIPLKDEEYIIVRHLLHEDLARAHLNVMADLIWLNKSHQDVRRHFKEAVDCARAASIDRPKDFDTLYLRLQLAPYALHNLIQDFDVAEELFSGVIKVFEKDLDQLAKVNEKKALVFLEMTKHAYTGLIETYQKRAVASYFVIDEDGHQQHANIVTDPNDCNSLLNQKDARKSLLWAERLKGRVLSKLLDTVTSTSDEKAHHLLLDGPFPGGISEHKFHNDDDWAMDFLFGARMGKIPIHIGPRIFFITYTMLSQNKLAITILQDDYILFFDCVDLRDKIDEETKNEAEEEMEHLRQGFRHPKNPDAASTSKSIPPPVQAMNEPESRMRYYSHWISGLVARFQRLTYEATAKLKDRESCKNELEHIDRLLQKFYDILIDPIADLLRYIESIHEDKDAYMLVFVPHEDLSVVPFPALLDEDGKYLIEKHPISVCPSMWILRHCQHLYVKQLGIPCGPELLVGKTTGYPWGWPDLPNAKVEIENIENCCDQSATKIFDSSDVEETRPMKERVMETGKTASWVHFAAHGEISRTFPHGSLLLGNNDMTRWNSDEITGAGLPCARSVVLSACQSGLGTLGGEGVLGFARAFVRAGVPSCFLSLWEVNDKYSLEFMKQLYEHLHKGETLANAVRKSTLCMMKQKVQGGRHRNLSESKRPAKWKVLDWAAFSCIGYGGVLAPTQRTMTSVPEAAIPN